jgi:uncharacterized protein YuzE
MKSMTVDQKLDVAYVELRKGKVARTVEFRPGMLVDFDVSGQVLGIEILSAQELAPVVTKNSHRKTSKKKSA